MSIASVESGGPQNVEIRLRSLKQEKAIALEESDERKILGDFTRFVENSDQSIPRIAALMGVSDAVLSMWIARTIKPTPIKLLEIKIFLEKLGPGPLRQQLWPVGITGYAGAGMMIECIRRFDPDITGDTATRLTKGGMRALDDV